MKEQRSAYCYRKDSGGLTATATLFKEVLGITIYILLYSAFINEELNNRVIPSVYQPNILA